MQYREHDRRREMGNENCGGGSYEASIVWAPPIDPIINYTSVTLTRNLFGFSLGILAWELEFGNLSLGTLV